METRSGSATWPAGRALIRRIRLSNVFAMFNNNGRSEVVGPPTNLLGEGERREVPQAPTNAAMLLNLL
jgi:hypothetical protein